jgi:thymidylate synthase (FAD)
MSYTPEAELVWITPDAEKLIVKMARVSNPHNEGNEDKLLSYLIRHQHWSPFEMASACFKITCTRDISRQILRHRSFSFQEFSQRYAAVSNAENVFREARAQDHKNRQNSIPDVLPGDTLDWWDVQQLGLQMRAQALYHAALEKGIAKECARAVLPEGLTETTLYMSGTIRSWLHYCELRMTPGTQKEHRDVAALISGQLSVYMPATWKAFAWRNGLNSCS